MTDGGFFLGTIDDAPASVRSLAGSLLPIAPGTRTIVVHVPADLSLSESRTIDIPDPVSHLCIVLERGARADIRVRLTSAAEMHAAEMFCGPEARCTLLTHNASAAESIRIAQRGRGEQGSLLRWQNVTLSSAPAEHDLVSRLIGPDAESAVDWMFYAKGTERHALTVRNMFDAPDGRGEILMRGIAEEKGYVSCKGLIDIGLKGGGTNTYLTQEVLMLDATSKVDAVPGLEIKTNDVKASHSATVARVTEEDLFYFGARGIDPREARRMFVLGFLGDITGRIADETAREEIVAAIGEKYGA